jgi:hypothetical protein
VGRRERRLAVRSLRRGARRENLPGSAADGVWDAGGEEVEDEAGLVHGQELGMPVAEEHVDAVGAVAGMVVGPFV